MSEPQDPQPHPQPQQPQQPQQPSYGPPPPGTPYSQSPLPPVAPGPQPLPVPPPDRGGLPVGAIIGIIGGAVGVVVLIGIAFFFLWMTVLLGPTPPRDDWPEPTTAPDLTGAAESVESYLTALAKGDADAALEYVWVEEGEDLLLTDEVLAEAARIAPIGDIEVGVASPGFEGYGATVPVSFELGDEWVDREFQLWEVSDGWEISDGLISVWIDGFTGLELEVNGVTAEGYQLVFPGVYEVTIDNEYLELDLPDGRIRLAEDLDSEGFYSLRLVTTELGDETFRSLVRASLDECLAMTTLTTPCGFEVSETQTGVAGSRVVEGTVQRELTEEGRAAFERLTIEQDYDPRTAMTTWDYFPVRITAQLASGETVQVQAGTMHFPSVDFAAAQPRVEWIA